MRLSDEEKAALEYMKSQPRGTTKYAKATNLVLAALCRVVGQNEILELALALHQQEQEKLLRRLAAPGPVVDEGMVRCGALLRRWRDDAGQDRSYREVKAELADELEDALAIATPKVAARNHQWWGAGEPDCPKEIKASNGELHTLRCKVCGTSDPSTVCADIALAEVQEAIREADAAIPLATTESGKRQYLRAQLRAKRLAVAYCRQAALTAALERKESSAALGEKRS